VYTRATSFSFRDAAGRLALPTSALLVLAIGTAVYVLDRDWASVQFLAPFASRQVDLAPVFGTLGQILPSFCHAYAFALLLILALGRSRRARLIGATSWFSVAAVCELVQAERIGDLVSKTAAARAGAPILDNFIRYVANGRFDPGDLGAAALGCLTAFLVTSAREKTP